MLIERFVDSLFFSLFELVLLDLSLVFLFFFLF